MYTNGHIVVSVNSYEIYTYGHGCLISAYGIIGTCGKYVVFDGYICCCHIYCYSMVNNVAVLWLFCFDICAVMWGLHVDYSRSAVGHTCLM